MASTIKKRLLKGHPFMLTVQTDEGVEELGFHLLFDFNASSAVEGATGYKMLNGKIFDNLNATSLSALFWAAILAYHPEYAGPNGLAVVRSMMDLRNADAVQEAVQEAFILSLPDAQQKVIREAVATEVDKTKAPLDPSSQPSS